PGGAVPQFSTSRWPSAGPVRALLEYLNRLHRNAGQPSLSDMGRAVALAPSTLSAFFTGKRMISQGNLELLVVHLGGDTQRAERLRRKAATAWNSGRGEQTRPPVPRARSGRRLGDLLPDPADGSLEAAPSDMARLDIVVFDGPDNLVNRPSQLVGRERDI